MDSLLEAVLGPDYNPDRNDEGAVAAKFALQDSELTREARAAANATVLATLGGVEKRMACVFLLQLDATGVKHTLDALSAYLMTECLPSFVHEKGGQVALATGVESHGDLLEPWQHSVKVAGETRCLLKEGCLFLHLPAERVVVKAEPELGTGDISIFVRSDGNSAAFWDEWGQYARRNNYLRGQAFFADGDIIERDRAYGWDDILLDDKTKALIRTHIEHFLRNRDRLRSLGVKGRRGLILSGPPGTGKTLLGKVLADTLDASFLWVSPRHVRVPDSFASILSVARFVAPTVVFLEDLDLFGQERDGGLSRGILGELMNQLDGAIDNEEIIAIATTNRLDVVEKALRNRPGRFDRVIEMPTMDEGSRRTFLGQRLANATITRLDLARLVQATDQYTGAQLEELANTLYMLAVEAQSEAGSDSATGDSPVTLSADFIDQALQEITTVHKRQLGFRVA